MRTNTRLQCLCVYLWSHQKHYPTSSYLSSQHTDICYKTLFPVCLCNNAKRSNVSVYHIWLLKKICEFSEHRAGLNSRGCQSGCCCLMKVCKPSLSKQLFPNFKYEACYRPPQSAADFIDTQDGEQVVQKPCRCFGILQLSLTSVSKTEVTAAGVWWDLLSTEWHLITIMSANLKTVQYVLKTTSTINCLSQFSKEY